MASALVLLPFVSFILSFVFAFFVLRALPGAPAQPLLLWASESYSMVWEASARDIRRFRLEPARLPAMVPVWRRPGGRLAGQGTVYLLARGRWANVTMILLALASLYAAFGIHGAARPFCDDKQLAHGKRAKWEGDHDAWRARAYAGLQRVWHRNTGGRGGVFGLAFLAQACAAAPNHRNI